jgi:phosphosulfolactate synthase
MSQPSFNFLSLDLAQPKPRTKGVTCVTDVMWTTAIMDDYLNDFAEIIDWVKIQNHRRTISTYTDEWFINRNKTLAKHNVGSYIGGMVFEMAYLQGKYIQFFEKNLELGFNAIEVSEDSIPDMPLGIRSSIIKEARSMGLRVFTEIGKNNQSPL